MGGGLASRHSRGTRGLGWGFRLAGEPGHVGLGFKLPGEKAANGEVGIERFPMKAITDSQKLDRRAFGRWGLDYVLTRLRPESLAR